MARSAALRDGMKEALVAMWSTILVRGLFGIALGICALLWPAQFLRFLTFAFGGYALVDGALTAWGALSPKAKGRNRLLLLASGIVSAVVGLAAILIPGEIAIYLVLLIGGWTIVMGIFQLISAVILRKELSGELWLAATGMISILFGAAIIANWAWGIVAVASLIGIAMLAIGVALMLLALRLWRIGKQILARTA
ncbi:HdeD family acid-resistance protein [Taklimakanibacter lacteus]|uniref:HdeD family acid-resistance protein n=1 Tax=Taklimakanibacter lacteus TaxID=2268456 RepID=UPI000E66CE34